ncbi:MAG: IclR family transcriptional regulator [Aliiglaciecola sp.]
MSENNKYAVPALDKGFDILEYLVEQELPKTQAEIAKGLNRSPNEIYRVLVGLEKRGYVVRDEKSNRYRISLKIYSLSRRISPIDQLRQVSIPHMEDLSVSIGLSCHLYMLYQSQIMVIVQATSHSPVSLNITEGALFPLVKSGPGRLLLANSNKEVRRMLVARDSTYQTMNAVEKYSLSESLRSIREDGFLASPSLITQGVFERSTLVGQPDGKVIAALTASSLNTVSGQKKDSELILAKLVETAKDITKQLEI